MPHSELSIKLKVKKSQFGKVKKLTESWDEANKFGRGNFIFSDVTGQANCQGDCDHRDDFGSDCTAIGRQSRHSLAPPKKYKFKLEVATL